MDYSAFHDATRIIRKEHDTMLKRYREFFGAGTVAFYNVCTVSSMISSVSLRLLSIPSEKCHYFCHRLACVLRFAKNNLYFRDIHAKYWTAGWLLLGNPVSSSRVDLLQLFWGPEALWQEGLYDNLTQFSDIWSIQTQLIQWSLRIRPGT